MSKVMETVALVMPAWPFLYTSSCRLVALTWLRLVMPSRKQIASRMLLLPDLRIVFVNCLELLRSQPTHSNQ